jgi:hypothetical protein
MKDNVVIQFLILVLAVKAGFLGLQFIAGFLPSGGPIGAIKTVLAK